MNPSVAVDAGVTLRDRYLAGDDFESMVGSARKNADLWAAVWKRAVAPDELVQRAAALGGAWHLLALSEDWCGDAVNTLPAIARLTDQAPNVDLRILARDANTDLMDAHLTGTSRSIPVVIVLDANYVERGWWGPRPAALQAWVKAEGAALDAPSRYREIRTWYARDRGRTTLEEILSVMERQSS